MYFLDTFAIIEYLNGNKKMAGIIRDGNFCTSDFELMELYYITLKNDGESTADKVYEAFAIYKVPIPEYTLKNAMKERLNLQKKGVNVSYVDVIGYQYAKDHKIKFVTGDAAFKDMDSKYIEFIKE